jgi:arsenate reductase
MMLSALGQETRLEAFRLLVRAAPHGLPAGEIAGRLGVVQNTMSAHLAALARCRLIRAERNGRSIAYRADYASIRELLAFLMEDCCQGAPEICAPFVDPVRRGAEPGVSPMADRPYNVLFLCTGNSARSILAEAILEREGGGRFRAFSAGSAPKGEVHPFALDLLRRANFKTDRFRSKSWDEFAQPDAPALDFVFTVCDNAASEVCPVWPGQPMTAHWGIPDPAAAQGNEAERRLAFADAFRMLSNRISIFVSLPIASLDRLALKRQLEAIGRKGAAGVAAG